MTSVTVRSNQTQGGSRVSDQFFDWLHGKWHDTFCPMGPCILSSGAVKNPQDLPIKLTVNGQIRQDGTTADMVFPVSAVIAFISQFVTLEPGDIIATGTPSGVGSAVGVYLKAGDMIRARLLQSGRLKLRWKQKIEARFDGS